MTNDIVASISEFLSPEFIDKLATASGISKPLAEKAAGSAVSKLLDSLAELVAKPGGVRKLMDALVHRAGDRGNFPSHLLGPAQFAAAGNRVLSSLLGDTSPKHLASSIADLHGIHLSAAMTILGMVTPRILFGLLRLQRSRELDANGLARMIVEQKSNVIVVFSAEPPTHQRNDAFPDLVVLQRPPVRPETTRASFGLATRTRHEVDVEKGVPWSHWALALSTLGALLWVLIPGQERSEHKVAAIPAAPQLLRPSSGEITYFVRPEATWKSIGPSRNTHLNRVVYNARGEQLGSVRNIMAGPDGKAAAAVISVGRYLGLGEKLVAVPYSALRSEGRAGDSHVVLDVTMDALLAAPQYEEAPTPKR